MWRRASDTRFRWRGVAPSLFLGGVLTFTFLRPPGTDTEWVWLGGFLVALGVIVRVSVVGHVPKQTSGRGPRLQASTLNTDGAYSLVRHPLYAGNVCMWTGMAALSGYGVVIVAGIAWFALTMPAVIATEDAFLASRFAPSYQKWRAATPAVLPRPRRVRPPALPFSVATVLRRESTTWWNAGFGIYVFGAARHATWIRPAEAAILLAVSVVWAIVHLLKYRTRVLHVPGR